MKLLGAVALIDEGETDWKVLAIDVEDPLASEIDDITGLEAKMPGKSELPHPILRAAVHLSLSLKHNYDCRTGIHY